MLGVSRPYLVDVIEKGERSVRRVGPRRRLLIADVLAYRADTNTSGARRCASSPRTTRSWA